jgi:S1-C subfamily serine protease
MTHGIISAKGRVISNELSHKRFDDFLQIDASINPGNSGGPLINLNGEVIGINTAMTASGSGIAFSVPINNVKNILANLYEYGRVKRGWVGLVAQELSSSEELSINWVPRRPKLKIMELVPKSPALIAGLQRGDFILKVNGTPMENLLQLSQQIAMSMPNSILNFVVLRGGSELSMAVKVSELENSQNKAIP